MYNFLCYAKAFKSNQVLFVYFVFISITLVGGAQRVLRFVSEGEFFFGGGLYCNIKHSLQSLIKVYNSMVFSTFTAV